jgi:hypothetical protein
MPTFSWHDYLLFASFLASIAGLVLLQTGSQKENEIEFADRMLFTMSFAHWLIFCVAFVAQKVICEEWESVLMSVKIIGVIAYLLTATCILSLPLHRVATRQPE